MKRSDLTRRLAVAMDITLIEADRIVLAFTGAIMTGVRRDGRVCIHGIGSFVERDVPARVSLNPNTGERIHIPAKKKLRFRTSKILSRIMNEGTL